MTPAPEQVQPLGCVLAGGRSSRMGQDKARLLFEGQTLLEHALELLHAVGCRVLIAGSRPDLASYAPVLPDLHPGCGPLSGIEAALTFAAAPSSAPATVLFMPVDLPLLPAGLLVLLLERAERTGALATIPFVGGRPQPLCAVYSARLLPGISAALAAGEYKVMRVIESVTRATVRDFFNLEALPAAYGSASGQDRAHRWFANINNPDDLAELTRMAAAHPSHG